MRLIVSVFVLALTALNVAANATLRFEESVDPVVASGPSCNAGQRLGPQQDAGSLNIELAPLPESCSQPGISIGRMDDGQDACCCVNALGVPCIVFGRKKRRSDLDVSELAVSRSSATTAGELATAVASSAAELEGAVASGALSLLYNLGGVVLTGNVNVHLIWYGGWAAGDPTIALVELFVANLGCSNYWAVMGTYYSQASASAPRQYVSGALTLGGSAIVNGSAIGDDECGVDGLQSAHDIITSTIASGALGVVDTNNDIFLILPSQEVSMPTNYPSVWCSYHYYWSDATTPMYMGVIGNTLRSQHCAFTSDITTPTPNGNFEADTLVNLIVHELTEFVTDGQNDGWESDTGVEVSDACSWNFGATTALPSGANYNVQVGGRLWLVQTVMDYLVPGCVNGLPLKK